MAAYSLKVLNRNTEFQHFALYQKLPVIAGPSIDFMSLAWMLGAVAPGSDNNPPFATFSWDIKYAALTGYTQTEGDAQNIRIFSEQSSINVEIDTQNSLSAVYLGNITDPGVPAFKPNVPTNGPKGVITIQSDQSIPTNSQQINAQTLVSIGLAMDNKAAVAVQLLPNIAHRFTPKPSYFIVAGTFIRGQVIDSSMTTNAYEVVFDGVSEKTIAFTESNVFVST